MHLVSGISAHAQRDRSRRRRQEEGGGGCDQFTDTKHSSWRGSSKQLEEIAGRWAEREGRGFTHTYKHTQTASVDFMSFVFTCFHRHWWRIFPQFLCDCCSPASHAVHVTEASRAVPNVSVWQWMHHPTYSFDAFLWYCNMICVHVQRLKNTALLPLGYYITQLPHLCVYSTCTHTHAHTQVWGRSRSSIMS